VSVNDDGKPTEEEVDNYYKEEFWIQTDWDKKPVTPIVCIKPNQIEIEED
jgi:hypothetical protein